MKSETHLVQEGDHVMFRKEDTLRLFQVHRNRDVWLDKCKFQLNNVIGQPWGSLFEVKDGEMVKIQRTVQQESASDAGRDNRNLQDSDSNQKLTQEEIEQMKREGVSGDHLIEQLIENSATFQTKTGYAQEKWVKKKKKKHLLQYTVLKPTTRLMCELQWSKGPAKILNLRVDSLAQILTMGNVRANMTVMVVESCLGLITGAVMERLGGYGKVISFYQGDSPMCCNLDNYDFSKEIMDTLYNFPLEQVNSLKQNKTELQNDSITRAAETVDQSQIVQEAPTGCKNDSANLENSQTHQSGAPVCSEEVNNGVEMDDSANLENSQTGTPVCSEEVNSEMEMDKIQAETDLVTIAEIEDQPVERSAKAGKWNKKRNKKPKKNRVELKLNRTKEIEAARKIIQLKNVDCLIVASKFYPNPIVMALIDFVAPSRQVVIYSQFKEALTDCYTYLREYKGCLNYRLTETWLREYQVLPDRTHPVIQMSGTGGYLLTATTVIKPST